MTWWEVSSLPARQHAGVVVQRLPAAPWGERRGTASTGGSHAGDLSWIHGLAEPIPELFQAFPGLGAVTLHYLQYILHLEGRARMAVCHAHSLGVTPEETAVHGVH